jgi:hypothetical protein
VRAALALGALAVALAGAAPAAAQPSQVTTDAAPAPPPRYDVALALPGLGAAALAVDAERDLPARKLSLVTGLAVRRAASGDYSSSTLAIGAEARRWLKRRAIWTRHRDAMVGWYVGGRLDVSLIRLHDDVMDSDHGQMVVAASALAGYRIAPWRGLELTPMAGVTWRTELDLDGRLPAARRAGLTFGLAAGWMF